MDNLKNLKKYLPKRKFRERDQLEKFKNKGFLEKKQDYKIRANDFQSKKSKYNKLIESARTKNPDEFYFGMIKESNDLSMEKNESKVKKYLNLVNHKINVFEKKVEKSKQNIGQLQVGNKQHKIIVDTLEDANNLNLEEYFNSNIIDNSNNRLKKEQLEVIEIKKENKNDKYNPQEIINLKTNLDKLHKIRNAINEKRIEKQLGKKRKQENGGYKFFQERKR